MGGCLIKNKIYFLLLLILSFSKIAFSGSTTGTGFFINEKGYAVVRYHLVADSDSIIGIANDKQVIFEVEAFDFVNDIALLKPKNPLKVTPLKLNPYAYSLKEELRNISYHKSADGKWVQFQNKGNVLSKSGIESDIRYFQVEFPVNARINEGPIFNSKGYCVGYLSDRVSDIFSLIHVPDKDKRVSLALKLDYVFPLIKEVEGLYWTQEEQNTSETPWEELGDSIVPIEVVKSKTIHVNRDEAFQAILEELPKNGLFIYTKFSTGIDHFGLAPVLLDELKLYKIGTQIPMIQKQKFYQTLIYKYGLSEKLEPSELAKMAADLSSGFYLEVDCDLSSGSVDDGVTIRLFEQNSYNVLAEVEEKKVIGENIQQGLRDLIHSALKKVVKILKEKKSPILQ